MIHQMRMPAIKVRLKKRLTWTVYFLGYFVCLTHVASALCPYPSVPYGATYVNVSGGADQNSWKIKYDCDSGFELFGDDVRECRDSKWKGDLPHCAVNVARYKPASASSVVGGGKAGRAVDGSRSTVHEGSKCTETKSEKSPWWTVDLLDSYPVKHVRLTTRCCDDVPIKKAEIRVGNSSTPGDNQLCNWIPRALEEGATETLDCYEDLVGRYVNIVMTGVETVLSLCEVEVFSSNEMSLTSCSKDIPPDDVSVFQNQCYHFLGEEVSGFESAKRKCQENKFHLIADLDDESTNYLKSRLENEEENHEGSLMAWVGAERESGFGNQNWNWVTGTSVRDINWGRGQPNNYNQEQNCAVLDSELDWKWNDISCRISALAVCQGAPSRCASPPVNEGSYYTGDLAVGKTLTYHCPLGEMPIGEQNQTCLETGDWSDQPIGCKKVDCGQVPGLADGEIHVLDGRTTWGARVRYKCKKNYSLMKGSAERTCLENGWSGDSPKCVYAKCDDPDPVDNAYVKQIGDEPNSIGAKIVYNCYEGYKASGSLSRECSLGGKWSGNTPRCEFVDCRDPPKVPNANFELLDGRTTFNAEVEYKCKQDYQLTSSTSKRRCESNRKWTRSSITCELIQCPPPRAPNGGRVSGYDREVHAMIEFSCLTGHVLRGAGTATCTGEGKWSSPTPVCRFIDCGALRPIDDGTISYVNSSTHLGSHARYSCHRSHSLAGEVERVCQENGRWSGEEPSCSEIRCAIPNRPNNTIINVSSTERLHGTSVFRSKLSMKAEYRVGSTLKYRCKRGYILESEDGSDARVITRRCTTSGAWTGSAPKCKFVDCGQPEVTENSEVTLATTNGTYYGSLAFYSCLDHFELEGRHRK